MSTLSPPPHHQTSVEHAAMDDAPGASLVTVVYKQLAALEALIAEGHAEATLLHADITDLSRQLSAACTRLAKLETTMANTERVLGAIRGGLLVLPSRQPEPPQPVAQHQQLTGNGVRQEIVEAPTPTRVQAAPSQVQSSVDVPASQPVSSPGVERAVPPAVVAPTSQSAPAPAAEARVPSATTTAAAPMVNAASNPPEQAQSTPQQEPNRGSVSPPPGTSAPVPVAAAPAPTPSVVAASQPTAPRAMPSATPAVVPPATARPPVPTASASVPNTPSRTNVPAQPPVTAAPPAQAASSSTPPAQARVNAPAPQERPATANPAPADAGPRVQRGSTVEVVFDNEGTETYTIVRRDEASATRNLISENSPLGQALLGATVGDVVRYRVGNGPELVVRVGAIA